MLLFSILHGNFDISPVWEKLQQPILSVLSQQRVIHFSERVVQLFLKTLKLPTHILGPQ